MKNLTFCGGGEDPNNKFLSQLLLANIEKMLCFKFHQNRAINKEFDFWRLDGGGWGEGLRVTSILKKKIG